MNKIVLDLAVTLDGFIEGPNGEIDWCIMDDDMEFDEFLNSISAIFYGRVSYDIWGNYQPDESASGAERDMLSAIHSKKKYVFSSQGRDDVNATFITGNIIENVEKIRQASEKDIWLYGGSNLITTFVNNDLIDVYRVAVHPTAIGAGKPLFTGLNGRLNLKLADARVFRSGVVQLIYERG